MFSKEMEALIEATLQDEVLTDQEKMVLVKRAQKEGIDVDELDVYIQSIQQKRKKQVDDAEMQEEKANKLGTIKRCVRCGGVIPLGSAVCPDCGLAIDNNSEGNAVSLLQQGILDLDKECTERTSGLTGFWGDAKRVSIFRDFCQQKFTFVSSYMVPNNRSDLLQLLAYSKPKANKNGNKSGYDQVSGCVLDFAYWCLFENCITLAQASFSNDPAFKVYFDFYEKEISKKSFFQRLLSKLGI